MRSLEVCFCWRAAGGQTMSWWKIGGRESCKPVPRKGRGPRGSKRLTGWKLPNHPEGGPRETQELGIIASNTVL